eukprot:scaffold339106_cov35-Prasinocladus_malaysianus.AAC.1
MIELHASLSLKQLGLLPDLQKRMLELSERLEAYESRVVKIEEGPNGLKTKLSKTDVDVTAMEQLPRLMIQVSSSPSHVTCAREK